MKNLASHIYKEVYNTNYLSNKILHRNITIAGYIKDEINSKINEDIISKFGNTFFNALYEEHQK